MKEFSIKWFVLDKERLKNWNYLWEAYFEDLLLEIKEIRASERKFYQKITDIFATSLDYDSNSPITKTFFATVQNKLHFAIHWKTASEVIITRANYKKENMWLTTWKNSPNGKISMTMEDWEIKLNAFLQFNEREILSWSWKITAEIAKIFTESEFEKYRVIQDRFYKSDFDKLLEEQKKLK